MTICDERPKRMMLGIFPIGRGHEWDLRRVVKLPFAGSWELYFDCKHCGADRDSVFTREQNMTGEQMKTVKAMKEQGGWRHLRDEKEGE